MAKDNEGISMLMFSPMFVNLSENLHFLIPGVLVGFLHSLASLKLHISL